jgi:hypothetical protein
MSSQSTPRATRSHGEKMPSTYTAPNRRLGRIFERHLVEILARAKAMVVRIQTSMKCAKSENSYSFARSSNGLDGEFLAIAPGDGQQRGRADGSFEVDVEFDLRVTSPAYGSADAQDRSDPWRETATERPGRSPCLTGTA